MITVHLQALGAVNSKPAGEFKVGEDMMWNFGLKNTIVSVEKETTKTITFSLQGSDGHLYSRKFNKDRQVGLPTN